MSGHLKWSTIKARRDWPMPKARKDFHAAGAKYRLPPATARPELTNFTLRLAIERGCVPRICPRTNIERAIRQPRGWKKDGVEIETIVYKAMGPRRAMLVECLTDNRNRTISDVRRAFTKANGAWVRSCCVVHGRYFRFNRQDDDDGEPLDVDPTPAMAALEAGAEDVEIGDDVVEVYTERTSFAQVSRGRRAGWSRARRSLS